jgi:predicted RNA-binding Zn-ribbon protein involved in translation (DUF1610 family)
MARDPVKEAEIELICPRCGYRMVRSAARLRRDTHLVCPECGQDIEPGAPSPSDDR